VLSKYAGLVVGFTLASAPAVALATPGFPGTIRAHLGLSYQPPCTLCHRSVQGGGPVVTLFGASLLERGLQAGSDSSLTSALDRLLAGTDPSSASASRIADKPTLSHGCVGRIAPTGSVGWPALVGVATFVLLVRRSRRRRGKLKR
jgi:hypothetical protein